MRFDKLTLRGARVYAPLTIAVNRNFAEIGSSKRNSCRRRKKQQLRREFPKKWYKYGEA
jgi:hypothetical protein